MSKIIVAHQPQFFPQLELYNKILKSNKFVLLDNVKFKTEAWHARTIIKDNTDKIIQLTIPCSKKNSLSGNIKDIKIADHRWKIKHLKTIEYIFQKTKYFNETYTIISNILSQKSDYLADYTIPSMIIFLEKLGYSKDKIFIQSKEEEIEGTKNDFLINLTKKFDGDEFLSGQGGRNYIDEDKFFENNTSHKFNDFKHPKYKIRYHDLLVLLPDSKSNANLKDSEI